MYLEVQGELTKLLVITFWKRRMD